MKTKEVNKRAMHEYQKDTAWKASEYKVISGPNTGKHGPEITPLWKLFRQWESKRRTSSLLDEKIYSIVVFKMYFLYYWRKSYQIIANLKI